ncbi:MAG TPA: GlsB/YeaQ/YmgE family stress response membrane protein [Anaerolineales bacterium]|nr:GlsB/YeaQ/YmgE family stress response membrane protein [Anaerolineales bacterium]HMZ44081.1 GlsB/YeaQ/YmgE family stress response membrane protein [Anaerolineales bacterium]HNA56401.1 GlsB/YeaQ/YmgE family stress response membrane protein [Anaerolineales bacterium]HND93997.1 GlsB/YeaQ/YmgE family stress response membrane protein [Anaerolineales bacterium]HNE70530.1 GlsB/YeaQ/YmgE family stress response membrane protein [Anaerolineales bacterium]
MNFLVWIIFGAIAGWVASIIMKRNKQMGALANIIVGVLGAFIGGYIMDFFGAEGVTGFNVPSLLVAILGAVLLLWIGNLLTGRRRR